MTVSVPTFHTNRPDSFWNANSDCPGPPPPTKTSSPSTTGEAAFSHLIWLPLYSASKFFFHIVLPVFRLKQNSSKSAESTKILPPSIEGVERGPSPPLFPLAPALPPLWPKSALLRDVDHFTSPVEAEKTARASFPSLFS